MIYLFVALLAAYFLVMVYRSLRYLKAKRLAAKFHHPFGIMPPRATKHMLVLGDSTMYGAGVKNPNNNVGGLLAEKFPAATVETIADMGAETSQLMAQFRKARFKHYDLVIVGIGGNDIVRLKRYAVIKRNLEGFLNVAGPQADHIVLCHSINIGNIGFFLFPLDLFFDMRSRRLSRLFDSVASHYSHVTYVNFYRPLGRDFINSKNRKQYVADDGFHPNDRANQYFFSLLYQQIERLKIGA